MSDLQKAYKALEAADAAGDTEAAREIASAIKTMQGAQASPTPETKETKPWYSIVTDPIKFGTDQATENLASGFKAAGKSTGIQQLEGVGQDLSNLVDAPKNYGKSYSETFSNAEGKGYNWSSLPGAMLEQAPQYAGSLATRAVGAGVGGAVAGPGGAVGGALAGPALFEFVQQVGPNALQVAKNNGRDVPTINDWKQAAGTSAFSGALNAIGVAKVPALNGLLGRTLMEGATETAQSGIQQAGTSVGTKAGLMVDPKAALAEGIIGGTAAGAMNLPAATGRGLVAVNRKAKAPYKVEDTDAATRVANRLAYVAENKGFDLKDPSTNRYTSEAFNEILGSAHTSLAEELKATFNELKPELNSLDDGTVEGIITKAVANAGIRDAKNKRKGIVTDEQYQTIERAVGDTDVGQKALSLLKESNELTRLANRDVMGGLSGKIEWMNPTSGSGLDKSVKAAMAATHGYLTGGLSVVGQTGVYGTARAIDKFTGRRYPVNKFVKDFAGKPTTPIEGISLKGRREQQKADALAAKQAQVEARKAQRQAETLARREQQAAARSNTYSVNRAAKADQEAFRANSQLVMRAMWEDPSVVTQDWLDTYGPELTKTDFRSAAIIKNRNERNAEKAAAKASGVKRTSSVVQRETGVSSDEALSMIKDMAKIIAKAPKKVPVAQALGGNTPVNSNTQIELPPLPDTRIRNMGAYDKAISKDAGIENNINRLAKQFKGTELGSALAYVYKHTKHNSYDKNGNIVKRRAGANPVRRHELIKEASSMIIDEQQFAEFMDLTEAYRERYPHDMVEQEKVDMDVPF